MFNWVDQLASWLVFEVFKLSEGSHLAEALHFFIYDTTKILILLFLVIFLMGIVNSFFPVKKVRNYLSRNRLFGFEYLMASLFGVVTPFCSCSSVPLFIGFVKGGIPLGVTFAFLITSPLVNEVAIGLFIGLFGLKVTAVYLISGVILGTVSGIILQKLRLERLLTPWVKEVLENAEREQDKFENEKVQFIQRLPVIWHEVLSILKGVVPYVIVGIAIGALMHGYIPEGYFEQAMGKENIWAVPMATIMAIPMYSNASGILPIVQVLVAKGIPIGTAMAFMMGVVGLSLPEAMLLKKVMTFKLIAIFFAVVAVCIIISGYLFNMIF
jgi:uncharacterized membrane protein YraQ (UPF0718 family)